MRLFLFLNLLFLSSCVSAYHKGVGGDTEKTFEQIYRTDFNTAWQAVIESLKSVRLETVNREGGFIQTRWTENTEAKNFIEPFFGSDSYLKAQYRFKVTVGKGFYNGQEAVKVAVEKEQMILRDVLDGWKPIVSDGVDENTLQYRIGRLVYIQMKIAKLEKEATERALKDLSF